jgi:hypothetical protein
MVLVRPCMSWSMYRPATSQSTSCNPSWLQSWCIAYSVAPFRYTIPYSMHHGISLIPTSTVMGSVPVPSIYPVQLIMSSLPWLVAVYLPYVPTTVIDFPAQGQCFQTGRVLRRHRRSIIDVSSRLRLGNTREKCKGFFKSISLHHNLLLKFC